MALGDRQLLIRKLGKNCVFTYFARVLYYTTEGGENYKLIELVNPYLTDFNIFMCPSINAVPINDPSNTITPVKRGVYYNFAGRDHPFFGSAEPVPNRTINLTSSQALWQDHNMRIRDERWYFNHGKGAREMHKPDNPSRVCLTSYGADKGKGANIAFGDGHVLFYRKNKLEDVGERTQSSSDCRIYSVFPE